MVNFSMNVHNYPQQIITTGLEGVINRMAVQSAGLGEGSVP